MICEQPDDSVFDPADIRRIRKKPGLSQETAGELIGGGPRAVQKYSTCDLVQSSAVSSALTLLDYDPKAPAVLRECQAKAPAHHAEIAPH